MDRVIRTYLEATEAACSPEQMRDAIFGVIAVLDCHAFAYITLPIDAAETPFLFSNYDVRWTTIYKARGDHRRDPVTRQATHSSKLFTWTPDIARAFDPAARDLFAEAETFGIRCGVTIPIRYFERSIAALTLLTDVRRPRFLSCVKDKGLALQFLAQHSHSCLRRLRQSQCLIEGILFTQRELECLDWAAQGKSRTDIALITGHSYRIVVRDIERAKAKLGVRTTNQATQIYSAWKATRGTG